MTYREAIKSSLDKMDFGKNNIPMSFPYLLITFTKILCYASAMMQDNENPNDVTVEEVVGILSCSENHFLEHISLFSTFLEFITNFLDEEIPDGNETDRKGLMWYDAEIIVPLWNEFIQKKQCESTNG